MDDKEEGSEMMDDIKIHGETKCPECKKVFYHTPDWAFKRYINGKLRFFCKYSCVLAHDRKIEEIKKAKRQYTTVK